MSYNKKNWQDNVSDITAAELNRMEQGIYDNSLIADAVTDTLNPTDTETYKIAELTEGQITDVIGVSDIVIKGQTLQDGTPTPSAPVDVNVVSGSNVVDISNKNLLDISNLNTQTQNGVTIIKNKDNSITLNGTSTSAITIDVLINEITLKENTTYVFSKNTNIAGASYALSLRESNTAYIDTTSLDSSAKSLNINLSTKKIAKYFRLYIVNGKTFTNHTFYPMLEQNSIATTYEPHQGKELPLDLPVENLLDIEGFTSTSGQRIVSNVTTGQTINGLFVKPGNYTASFKVTQLPSTDYRMQLVASSDSTQTQSGADLTNILKTEAIGCYNLGNYSIGITVTQACYLYLRCVPYGFTIKNIQIEQGSKANAYTPYGTEPIELCKIGNYQDYFYKSGSKWYLHKEINKKVLNGSENWEYQNNHRFVIRGAVFDEQNMPKLASTNSNKDGILSTNFIEVTPNEAWSTTTGKEGIAYLSSQEEGIAIACNSIATTTADFKTWLSSNLPSVYYILKTSRNIEITNTTLISQLEAIYNAPLYEETNITQTNNDLPMVLDITACKDNINGIKAFIRK